MTFFLKYWQYIVMGLLVAAFVGCSIFLLIELQRDATTIQRQSDRIDQLNDAVLSSEAARIREKQVSDQTAIDIIAQRDRAKADLEILKAKENKIRQAAKERPDEAGEIPLLLFNSAHDRL